MIDSIAVKPRITPEENELARGEAIAGRKEKRYSANAQAKMRESALILKDVSLNGGCVQSEGFMELVPNGSYTLVIIPEEESRIDTFEVDIISRWVRMKRNGSESGFIIVMPPGSTIVEEYIEFLRARNANNVEDGV
jgi:hypothetical protein